jgi:hypothetical protein
LPPPQQQQQQQPMFLGLDGLIKSLRKINFWLYLTFLPTSSWILVLEIYPAVVGL